MVIEPGQGATPDAPDLVTRARSSLLPIETAPDELLPAAADRSFQWTLLMYRQTALTLLTVVFALMLPDEPGKWLLLAYTVADMIGGGALLFFSQQRSARPPALLPWVEAACLIGLIAYSPGRTGTVLLLALCQFSVGSAIFGTWPATLATLSVVVAAPVLDRLFVFTGRNRGSNFDQVTAVLLFLFIPALGLINRRVQRNERDARKQYVDLLTGLDAVVWEGDPESLVRTFVSPQSRDLLRLDPRALMDRWSEYVYPDDREREEASRRAGVTNERDFVIDFRMVGGDGNVVFVRDTVRVERDDNGKPLRMRGVLVDITRQQEAEATVRKQALYDSLTGLPNRALFNDQLRLRLDAARGEGDGLAVLLLDLNGFKEVNDTLGHAVGDHLLQAIAGRLGAYLPDRSLVARLGGDEFAVLVQPANAATANRVADTIASCLSPPITVDDMTIQAGAATGIALFPGDGDDGAALLRRADAAMYEAKQSGRSHMFATPDDDAANVQRLQLLGEMRASIASGDFRVYHQPKVDLKTGRVVGTEGLVRWQHRQLGLLTPAAFIELSELSGLIQPLTRWVLEQGIRQAAAWRAEGFELAVALNLSVRNFFDQGLPAYIAQLLAEHKLPGEFLVLEITEREVMADRALARAALLSFRSLGVKISVDDFGTGFSSLSQLQQLPIDEIKVDASFVRGMLVNQQDAVIVRSIIDLGHNLGLEVVAEGAETAEELRALRALGADRVQGYVVSKPLPPEEFTRWLRRLSGRPDPVEAAAAPKATGEPAPVPARPRGPRPSRLAALGASPGTGGSPSTGNAPSAVPAAGAPPGGGSDGPARVGGQPVPAPAQMLRVPAAG